MGKNEYKTRLSLLSRVRKGDEVSCNEFYKHYKGLFFNALKNFYLTAEEKEEVYQNSMTLFFDKIGNFNYDKSKGGLSAYLRCVFRGKAIDFLRKKKSRSTQLESVEWKELQESAETSFDEIWNEEWYKLEAEAAMEALIDKISIKDYQIYESYVIDKNSANDVADFFDSNRDYVYHVKRKLEKIIAKYIEEQQGE